MSSLDLMIDTVSRAVHSRPLGRRICQARRAGKILGWTRWEGRYQQTDADGVTREGIRSAGLALTSAGAIRKASRA